MNKKRKNNPAVFKDAKDIGKIKDLPGQVGNGLKKTPGTIILWIAAAVLVYSYFNVADIDTFFHLSIGRYIIEHGFPAKDPFSMHNLSYLPQEWLSQVIFYFIYNFFGFIGLYVFQIIITALIVYIVYRINFLVSGNKKYLSLFLAIAFVALLEYTFIRIRPQTFTYLVFALEIYILEHFIRNKNVKILLFLPLLSILLANLHIGAYPMFFIFMLPYIADLLVKADFHRVRLGYFKKQDCSTLKPLVIIMLVSLPLGILNPYGIKNLLYFKTMFNPEITKNIVEWHRPGFDNIHGIIACISLVVSILAIIFLYFIFKKPFGLKSLLLYAGLAFMTLWAVRFYAYFILILGIVLIESIDPVYIKSVDKSANKKAKGKSGNKFGLAKILESKPMPAVLAVIIVLTVLTKSLIGAWEIADFGFYPVKAVEYIKKNLDYKNIRLYNDYDYGSYLMFNGIKVFIDSRGDLYSSGYNPGCTVIKDYADIMNDPSGFESVFKKYDFQYVLINPYVNEYLNAGLKDNPSYKKVYHDEYFILYKKL